MEFDNEKLKEIQQLDYGWNGYSAKSFKAKLLQKTQTILNLLDFNPKIFPTGRNSIQLEWETKSGEYLEIEIYEDDITIYYGKGNNNEV